MSHATLLVSCLRCKIRWLRYSLLIDIKLFILQKHALSVSYMISTSGQYHMYCIFSLIFLDRGSGHDGWHNEPAGQEPWPDFSSEEEADEPTADPQDPVAAEGDRISKVLDEVEYVQQLQYIPPRRQSGAL